MKKIVVLHPILFAIYPIVALLAFNISQLSLSDGYRALLWSVAGTAVFFVCLRLIIHNWHRAGLATSLAVVLFFSFGHVLRFTERLLPQVSVLLRFQVLFILWMGLMLFGIYWIGRVVRRDLQGVTQGLNVVTAVLLIFPLFTIISFALQARDDDVVTPVPASSAATPVVTSSGLPDIYYIILDGYGRADVLAELYDLDNTEFISALEDRGFYIASNSHSNYAQTHLSLASSMNRMYLDTLANQAGPTSENREPLAEMIHNSQNVSFLHQRGYQLVSIHSGFAATEMTDADVFLTSQQNNLNNFESLVIADTLPGIFIMSRAILYDQHRSTITNVFDRLGETAVLPSPKFVFAHVIAPHPPFVFDADGNPVQPNRDFGIHDGVVFGTTRAEYIAGYRDQLTYLNTRVLAAVDAILAGSTTTPIIIIQGDHGPGAFLDWESVENTCLRERHGILNAYLVPEEVRTELYDSITPVNSFRILFDTLFDGRFGTLPDKSYFSAWKRPYDLIEVTNRIEASCSQ
jgi:hypothetical protein